MQKANELENYIIELGSQEKWYDLEASHSNYHYCHQYIEQQ